MSFVISSVLAFPNISWWCKVLEVQKVCFDVAEHFEKMTYRNRFYIATASGVHKLSLPVEGGREHKQVMDEVGISYRENWQKQHWRTLYSAYNNTPYFEHYAPALEKLYQTRFGKLVEFNMAGTLWLKEQLGLKFEHETLTTYQTQYNDAMYDLRKMKPGFENCTICDFPLYYQIFQERTGFIPNLSLLDLLFVEGPFTLKWLRENCETILAWSTDKN